MVHRARFLLLILMLSFWIGCEEPFSPKDPFEKKMVVYSLFSNKSDTQYVRVYTTYDAAGSDPLQNTIDTPVTDAVVTVTLGAAQARSQDTTLQRQDESRYSSSVLAYRFYPLKLERGKTYTLTVNSPSQGQAVASVTIPDQGSILAENTYLLRDPWYTIDDVAFYAQLSNVTKGFLLRFFLDYEIYIKDKGWFPQLLQIPLSVLRGDSLSNYVADYPKLIRRSSGLSTGRYAHPSDVPKEIATYPNNVYRTMIRMIRRAYHPDDLKLKQVVVQLIQVEPQFYDYYNIVNGFRDLTSIRVDQPDYTNIKGGIGVFGAFTVDYQTYEVPDTLGFNR